MVRSAKATPSDSRIRKIGERRETLTVELTPDELDAAQKKVIELVTRKNNLEASLKSHSADYKARIKAVEQGIAETCHAAQTGKREIEIDIEEWLTASREVVRMRADTGEPLGRRAARPDELQEELPHITTAGSVTGGFTTVKLDELSFPDVDDAFRPVNG